MCGLTDLVTVVNESASVNVAQPTGREDESPIIATYNWQDYFSTFCTKVKASSPRTIFVKEKASSPEVLDLR